MRHPCKIHYETLDFWLRKPWFVLLRNLCNWLKQGFRIDHSLRKPYTKKRDELQRSQCNSTFFFSILIHDLSTFLHFDIFTFDIFRFRYFYFRHFYFRRYSSESAYIPVTYTHCLSVCLLLISAYVTFLLSFHFTPIVILSFTQNMLVLCYSSIVTNSLLKNKSSERHENLHTICNHDAYTEFKPSLKTKQRLPLIFKLSLSIYIAPTKIYRMIYNLSRRSISIRENHVSQYHMSCHNVHIREHVGSTDP